VDMYTFLYTSSSRVGLFAISVASNDMFVDALQD